MLATALVVAAACSGSDPARRASALGDDRITIGSFDFPESTLLAELYAQAEAASGKDLSAYFQAWVMGTTLPRLEVSHGRREGGVTAVDVRAQGPPGPVPLEVTLVTAGGRESRVVQLPPEGGQFTFETKTAVRRVEVNQDSGLLLAGVTRH